jgi:hypothetical protein
LAAWPFGNFIFHVQADAFFDGNKARRFGFHEMHLNSAEEIVRLMPFCAETVADTAPRLPVLRASIRPTSATAVRKRSTSPPHLSFGQGRSIVPR